MWSPFAAERQQRDHLRRHAGRRRERRAPAFERRDALLERRDRRIRDPRIDVAERLQVEQARRVVGAVEHERRRLVDRQRARARRRIRNLAGVQAQRVEAEFAVSHAVPRARRARPPRRNDAGVDARPIEPADDARVLDLDAAILTTSRPGIARDLRRFVVADAELHPENLRAAWRPHRARAHGISSGLRKQSTMSTGSGIDARSG